MFVCIMYATQDHFFNKDNMEHVAPVKQTHVECLGSLFGKDDVTCEMLAKQVFKPL